MKRGEIMKNEGHSRREFLRKAAIGGVGVTLGSDLAQRISDLWVVKAEHGDAVLDLHQMLTLAAIATQIIPTDETPGAREVGVVDSIDAQIKATASLREIYPKGLAEVDRQSERQFGSQFIRLEQNQQTEVLKGLEKSPFFKQVWTDTIVAFCRSPVGQKVMGYPGGSQPHGYMDTTSPPGHSH